MQASVPQRPSRLLWLTGLLAAAVTLWIGHFLATFDLNRYREQVAGELSSRLGMPVQLGDAHLELREAGLAFRFTELRIGTAQSAAELHAETLWLQLAWHGLLLKKPILTEIALNAPQLRITLPSPVPLSSAAPDVQPPIGLDLISGLQIRRIELQQGKLDLGWRDADGTAHAINLDGITAELGDFGLARSVTFNMTGNLLRHPEAARLAVQGRVELPASGPLSNAGWDLALEAKNLDAALLAGLLPESADIAARGNVDFAVYLKGRLADTLTVQAELNGRQLFVRPGAAYQQALPLKHLQLAGTWQRQDGTHLFRQLAVQLDELRVAGELAVKDTATAREISGTLRNGTLPVDALRRWLPSQWQADNPAFTRLRPGGIFLLSQAAFRGALPVAPEQHNSFALDDLRGEVRNLGWTVGEDKTAELTRLALHLENDQWLLEQGTGTVAGLPVAFSGNLTSATDGPHGIDLDVAVSGTAEQLIALGPEPLPTELSITGPLKVKARVNGTTEQYLVDAQADLSQLDLRYGETHIPPTPGATLTAQGQGNRTAVTIAQSALSLATLSGQLAGSIDWAESPHVNLTARLELPDLTGAYSFAPVLDQLQLHGSAALNLALDGPVSELRRAISLDLNEIGIPTRGFVADITRLNGRLMLEGKGLRSEKAMTAQLGKSPVTLRARVADLAAPRLELDVQAPAVRADELIFRSDRSVLRDLSGHLIFDRNGLWFAPVKVRLDGGTRVTVNGSVRNFAEPRVDLDITGEYAHVEEIIGLWTNQSPAAEAARKARQNGAASKPLPPIRINAEATRGDLYGMTFAKARALIVPTSERLLIHPLDFSVDEGECTTQVLVDFTGPHPLLQLSGHVKDIDAYQVYNELLDRKSIVRGQLRGDFYLQGELGKPGFLPTSYGSFNVSVRDGVMRHSPVLSTIFSLLNVSQLFALELPDVSREGVPFTKLTAEAQIDKGVLSSENVVMDSNAMSMSYVGKYDMVRSDLDLLVVVKPLGTIDKVVSNLPIAGWILGGEERALITTQFKVTGPADKPKVEAIPISAISQGVLGIFQRTLGLPLKLIEDPAILWGGGGEKQ